MGGCAFHSAENTAKLDRPRITVYPPHMEYLSKSYRLDEEVVAWLEKLKSMHGSVNKGLRLIAFPGSGDERAAPPVDVEAVERKPNVMHARSGQPFKGPLLKPGAKKN